MNAAIIISLVGLAMTLLGTVLVMTWKGAQLVSKIETRSDAIDKIPLLAQRVDMVERVVEHLAKDASEVRPSVAGLVVAMKHVRERLKSHSGELTATRVPTPPQPIRPARRPSRPETE